MNLEKLLAANMIRFGTRNLTEHQVRKILKEQTGNPGVVVNPNPLIQTFVTTPTSWPPIFTKHVATMKALLTKAGITFSNISIDLAAAHIILCTAGNSKELFQALKKGKIEMIGPIVDPQIVDNVTWAKQTPIQLNESPDEKGKVLTVGIVTKDGPSNQTPGESSELTAIVQYMNDYNIAGITQHDYNINVSGADDMEQINIQYPNSMIQPKQPGAGSLNIGNSFGEYTWPILYSTQKYTAATGASVGTQTTDVVWTEGPETKADLPQNMFAKMKIKLDATLTPLLTTAIEGAKKIGTITGLRIESGASFDEPVVLNNAAFAKEVGMASNQVPADPTLDKEGVVTDPMSGGNAFLAYMRGKAIETAIGNTAGVTPTMTATVATGGAAARFAALYFNIKKPDGTTTTTKDDLKSIGAKTNVQQLGGLLQIMKYDMGN